MTLAEGVEAKELREAIEELLARGVESKADFEHPVRTGLEKYLSRPKSSYEQEAAMAEAIISAARKAYSEVSCAHCQDPEVGGLHTNWCPSGKLNDVIKELDEFREKKGR